MTKRVFITMTTVLLFSSSLFAQRETRFFSSFEYGSLADEPVVFAPEHLNGAEDQIGTWVGEEFPDGVGGDIIPIPDWAGFKNNPYDGGRLLVLDRPGGSLDDDSDFVGTIDAELSDPVLLLGAQISFELGVRRTNGNNNKDFDIVGLGSDGNESFRLRVGTNSNNGQRLGYVSDGATTFDLPTVVGNDAPTDLNNTGYNANLEGPYDDLGGPDPTAEFPEIVLTLGDDGYTIDLAHQPENTSAEANAYKSALLPYNGSASDLAVVQFEYVGSTNTGFNSGYFLDNVLITGFEEILLGDFNGNGSLDFADFLIFTNNFGTASSDGDFNFDGVVDGQDWLGFKNAYVNANPSGAQAVPEPAGVGLLTFALLTGLSIRRRRS